MQDEKKGETRRRIIDPFWAAVGLIGLCLIGLCYVIAIGSLAISGHYEGAGTLSSVSGWLLIPALLLWLFVEIMGEETKAGDLAWNGLYLNRALAGLPVVALTVIFVTIGRSQLSSLDANLGLGSFPAIFLMNGVLLTIIGYYRGVVPYRAQWRAWNRRGRKATAYDEESKDHERRYRSSGGDPRGWHPGRVGPFRLSEWILGFVFNWMLFIVGSVLTACGLALIVI